jgi:flagellar basal body rod protein FlgG
MRDSRVWRPEKNASLAGEMIDMIATQRAYELNTQAAKNVDQMLGFLTQVAQ